MATKHKVKDYLAYWLQTGKRLFYPAMPDGHKFTSIIQGDRYSREFEECWEHICDPSSGEVHLEGMIQTIQELLSPEWEIMSCSRCEMPIPMVVLGANDSICPCNDIELWPNLEVPQPRSPIDSNQRLLAIQSRLLAVSIALDQATEVAREDNHSQNSSESSSSSSQAGGDQRKAPLTGIHLAPTLDYDEER